MNVDSKITVHMVSSLDGFIAKDNEDVSWMYSTDQYDKGVELTDEEISNFLQSVDCYVMGSKTYETAIELGWPYGDKPVFVLTSRSLERIKSTVQFCHGDLDSFVEKKLKPNYQNIWMVGGATLTRDFINQGLVDELVISTIPVILGQGIRFFQDIHKQIALHLKEEKAYSDGMVELTYEIIKPER